MADGRKAYSLEEVVDKIGQRGRDAVVVFATDDDVAVGSGIELGDLCKLHAECGCVGRGIALDLFPHLVQKRKVERGGIDDDGFVAAFFELRDDPLCRASAHALCPNRSLQHCNHHG